MKPKLSVEIEPVNEYCDYCQLELFGKPSDYVFTRSDGDVNMLCYRCKNIAMLEDHEDGKHKKGNDHRGRNKKPVEPPGRFE